MVGEEACCCVDGVLDVISDQPRTGGLGQASEDAAVEHLSGVCGPFLSTACLVMVQETKLTKKDPPIL